jgi:hypothetical protein
MKSGIVPSTTLVVVKPSSVRRPWPRRVSTPAATPSGTAIAMATTKPSTASHRVAGRRCAMMSDVESFEISEVPKSPVKSPCR